MAIKLALFLSIVLQFSAAIIAISLTKRTRTNIAWWLISLGFLLMAIRRVFEILQIFDFSNDFNSQLLSSWTGVLISIIILISLLFIKRLFNIQKQLDDLRKQNETRVLSAIIRTEEKERQHFAKELHDGLGPLLSSVKMAISSTRYPAPQNQEILTNAEKLIDESILTLKEVSNNLSPHVLNNFGLLKAIKSFINKLNAIDHIQIKLNSNIDNKRFAYNVEVVLYRVCCELLSNTMKYATANNIYIDLIANNSTITLEYIDDGIGFDMKSNEKIGKGMGFANIQSRIKSLNGSYSIYSAPNEGVHVKIKIYLG